MPTIPWTTPKTTGDVDDPDAEIVVMSSRFELLSLRQVPGFLVAALRIRQQMLASPGVVGLSLIAQPLRKTFYTLSAWRDREALDTAVGNQPHAGTMSDYHPRMAGAQFAFWTIPCREVPPSWDEALDRLRVAGDDGD